MADREHRTWELFSVPAAFGRESKIPPRWAKNLPLLHTFESRVSLLASPAKERHSITTGPCRKISRTLHKFTTKKRYLRHGPAKIGGHLRSRKKKRKSLVVVNNKTCCCHKIETKQLLKAIRSTLFYTLSSLSISINQSS